MADQPQQPQQPAPAQQAPKAPQQAATPGKLMFAGFAAEIVDINKVAKTGISGEIYSVSCRILEGNDRGRIIRRNVLGPIKIGDVVRLPDTSREAREIRVK